MIVSQNSAASDIRLTGHDNICLNREVIPVTGKRLIYRSNIFEMRPNLSLLPLDMCQVQPGGKFATVPVLAGVSHCCDDRRRR